jgi:hypothetical protein
MFGMGKAVCWSGRICGGKAVHDTLFFKLEDAEKLVKDLKKRLKDAEMLLGDVRKMWGRKNAKGRLSSVYHKA